MNLILVQCLTLFCAVFSLGISLPQLPAFPYIENAVGVHTFTLSQRTPPTVKSTTLYILLSNNEEESTKIGNGCPDNSTLCAITKIDLNNGEDPIITQKFSVAENYTSIHSSPYGISIGWRNQVWGELSVNLRLHMECLHDDFLDDTDSLVWNGGQAGISGNNHLRWKSKSFCNSAANGDDKKSWGFFTILFLVIVVTLTGYLIAQAWLNTSKVGSSGNLFNELMATIAENFRKLPHFIGKVIQYFGSP